MTWLLSLHPQPLRGTRGACEIPRSRGSVGAGLRQSRGASPDGKSGAWERVHWSQDSQSDKEISDTLHGAERNRDADVHRQCQRNSGEGA